MSEQIGMDRFWKSCGWGLAGRWEMSEQIGRMCTSKIRTECCQSLLEIPEAEVLAGVKSPRVGSGSESGGRGNQRAWESGVGAEERPTSAGTAD